MRRVPLELKVLRLETVDLPLLRPSPDPQRRERPRPIAQLLAEGLDVVGVDVRVAQGVDKVSRREAADVGEHAGEEGVGGDVEGDAEA